MSGFDTFVRGNPMSDKISVLSFHHVEFYCGDATAYSKRFMASLGVEMVSKSDNSTGNSVYASYLMQSGQMRMLFTAPYHAKGEPSTATPPDLPLPGYSPAFAADFFTIHGFGARAVGVVVEDVQAAYATMTANGGVSVLAPCTVTDKSGTVQMAEVKLYGDVVIRLLDTTAFTGEFLPNYVDVKTPSQGLQGVGKYGVDRFDHIVGNVWSLEATKNYIKDMLGFHDFAEFSAEDVGTVDSGLNSVVLANNNEMILFPINEPTYGTKRKSQIQTYLEQNQGEGVQHMALFSNDIFGTLRLMRDATDWGGFEFMAAQPADYYARCRARIGFQGLTEAQYVLAEEMGILIDQDDQGILLQIFTKPLGDRPTIFIEIIQRLGCKDATGVQKPGCGGFGKGNFRDLFKSIEVYENELAIN
ncbi:4-hydroxyphenylpyruvate dioxygenase [Ochromonadaceae sp. CCMP2298]|nr:4-hydroxyphenylpyruvate dioxygenase [Ochromonadaceae sp. CCMP2298]